MKHFFRTMSLLVALVLFGGTGKAQCPPGETACFVTVYCGDMIGDGWNGGVLQVWQDTVLRGSVSLASGYEGQYDVPVCSGDTMRFVWISGPLDYEISFSIVNGDGSVILPEAYAGDISSGTIVAMAMPACPSCVRPLSLVCQPDSTSVAVSWVPLGTESLWHVYLDGSFYAAVNTPSVNISGLTLNTDYTIGVRAVCSTSDSSELIAATVRTTCPPLRLPYYNTFDGEVLGELPNCWIPIITFSDAPKVYDEAAFSDSLSLFFGASGWNVVATPLVPVPGNRINVAFRAQIENGIIIGTFNLFNSRLRVGVMTDLSDTSTFIPMVDIRNMDGQWHDYEFNTSLLDSMASYYVAFFFKGDDFLFGNGFVDDLSITYDNGCHRPDYVVVDSVGSRSATLSWASVAGSATGYYVYYSSENNVFNSTFYTFVTDTTVVLRGLDQATTYYAWIRTACTDDSSEYRGSAPFTTAMTCAPVSDVRLGNVHYTAAMVSWQYDFLNGNPSTGAWLTLYDQLNPSTPVVDTVVFDNSAVFTGLQPSHSYTVQVRNLCQLGENLDTANYVSFDFMTNSCSEVAGDGTLSSSAFFVNTNMTNSYSQTLYLRDELPATDTIWGIAYRTSSGVTEPLDFSLYMGNTSLNALALDNYVAADSLTPMVTNYVMQPSQAEWRVIRFATPFVYDTSRNLAVAVNHSGSHFFLNPTSWYYHPTAYNATVTWSNFGPISMASPSSPFSANALQFAADIRLITACQVPSCTEPMVVDVEADSTSLALLWINDGTPDSGYVVQYKPSSSSSFITDGSTHLLQYTISSLSPATRYDVRVGAVCQGDTLWNQVSAVTDCGSVHIPYTENFDSYPVGTMPPCWSYNRRIIDHRYGGLFWQPSVAVAGAVLPVFQYPVNQLEINFKAMMASYGQGEGVMVGVTDDDGTFVEWLDTLIDPAQSLSHYTWFRYDFSGYEGSGNRIVLAHSATQSEATLIDEISVLEAVGCLPVENMTLHNLDNASNITLTWNDPSPAVQWQVAWDTIGTPLASMLNTATVSTASYSFPPMVSGGKYTVYVRAVCGLGESAWRSVDFAAGTIIMDAVGSDTVTGCGLVVYDNGGPQWEYSNNCNSLLIIRPSDATLSVRINSGTVELNPWGGDTLRIYEGEGTSGELLYEMGATYGPESLDAVLVSESGAMTIQFVSNSNSTASGYELFTSCVEDSPCRRPRNVQVNVTSPSAATVSWTGTALSFDVRYRAEGSTTWQTTNVSATTANLTGLAPGTRYELLVQGFCTEGSRSPSSTPVYFTTLCNAYNVVAGSPISESFESPEAPAACFTMLSAEGNTNTMIHSTDMAYDGTASFRFCSNERSSNYNQYLISPLLHSVDSLTFRFRYSDRMYGQEKLRVGYSVSGNSPDDFIWTDTLTTNGIVWKLFKTDFPANTRFLAINYCSNWRYYAFVDSLQISVVASADCQAPVITRVSETDNSITVNFSASGSVEAYITDQPWNDNVNGVTVSGESHTFEGLQPNTSYVIGLRNHCNSGIISHWTTCEVITATENCPAPTDFELAATDFSSATFNWTADSGTWEINVFNTFYNNSFTVTQSPFTISGLYSDVTYNARIRSLCDGMPGEWCDTLIAFTTVRCEPVTQPESYVLDPDSGIVLLTWHSSVGNYELSYGLEHFDIGSGTVITGITNERYRLTGLTPGETYDFYIRAQCNESVLSTYSERGTFTVASQGIGQTDAAVSVMLHPNPATHQVTLSLSGIDQQLTVDVVDITGRAVMRHTMSGADSNLTLDISPLPAGFYFVRIAGPSFSTVQKLIVQ